MRMLSVLMFVATAKASLAAGDVAPVMQLQDAGKVSGVATAGSGAYFLSLPFAAAPVDEKRWLPPLPVPPWPGTMDASAFKPPS